MDCPRVRYPQLNDVVEADLAEQGYQVLTDPGQQVDKVIQLYEVSCLAPPVRITSNCISLDVRALLVYTGGTAQQKNACNCGISGQAELIVSEAECKVMTGVSIHTGSFCVTGVDDTAHCHGGGSDRRRQVCHPADFGSLTDQDGQAHHHECPQPKGEPIVSAAVAMQLKSAVLCCKQALGS